VSAVDSDPYSANHFEVDLGVGVIGFAEVSGLGYEIDYVEEAAPDRRRPPATRIVARVTEVGLRRCVNGDPAVWQWVHAAVAGKDEPRTVTIRLLDAQGNPACQWVLRGARPIRWLGPALSATATSVAMEELVLRAESIEFTTG